MNEALGQQIQTESINDNISHSHQRRNSTNPSKARAYESSRNSNFEADVLKTQSPWALLPMIFVISIFELTKMARSAFKVLGVGSIGLLVSGPYRAKWGRD